MPRVPALKPYSQWDYWWVVEQTTMQKRRLRYPPQLGVRPSMLQRGLIWWLDHAWMRWIVGGLCLFVLCLGTLWLVAGASNPWVITAGIGFLGLVSVSSVWWRGGGVDGRCVAAAHLRVRCTRQKDVRKLACEVGDRRRLWKVLMADMPRSLQNAILRQSTSWRIVKALYLFVLMSGPLIGPLANAMAAPAASGGKAARAGFLMNTVWAFYQQGAVFACVIVFIVWQRVTWNRIRSRLSDAIDGRCCPDCGYEVEQGSVVQTEPHIEIAIGPERCSECGCPWPLIPSDSGIEPERWERRP